MGESSGRSRLEMRFGSLRGKVPWREQRLDKREAKDKSQETPIGQRVGLRLDGQWKKMENWREQSEEFKEATEGGKMLGEGNCWRYIYI